MLSRTRCLQLFQRTSLPVNLSLVRHAKPFKKKWVGVLARALRTSSSRLVSIQMFSSHHGSHSNELALEYFDFTYPLIFHRHWPTIRLALLSVPKPVAVLNPYSLSHAHVKEKLIEQGAVDLLRLDNDTLRKDHLAIQERIARSDNEYGIGKLLEQREKRRLLGTSDLTDEPDDPAATDTDDQNRDIDEDEESMNTFNTPEPVQKLDDIYRQALEKQVRCAESVWRRRVEGYSCSLGSIRSERQRCSDCG